jgi:hypothetical protein
VCLVGEEQCGWQRMIEVEDDRGWNRFWVRDKDFFRASLPTGGAPLSCHFAFDYSEPYSHRRPKQKPPLPRNRSHFGSVPTVAAAWWSSRDLRLPRSNSVLHPLSPESPHDTTIPISLTRCLSPPATVVRPSCRQTSSPFPTAPQTLAPTPRKLPPDQSSLPSSSFHSLFPKPFSSFQHHSICIGASPPAASFKQLYRTRPARRPEPACALVMGRIRYSTSVSG